ncbi:MAG: hypothetical protein ABII96_09500, partial [Candidatus Zixiibacteriota bacterium]
MTTRSMLCFSISDSSWIKLEKGRKVVFLSNKPIQTREDYASKLTRLGIPTKPDEVINSTLVVTNYLKKNGPQA